jgi:hypothetical protein
MRVDQLTLRRTPGRPASRRIAGALVAAIVAISLGVTVGVAPAQAATDLLRESVVSTYLVDGAKGAVHVTLDIKATNLKPSTATTFYFYDTLSLGIQPEARSVSATSNGRRLDVTIKDQPGYRDLLIHTPRLLYHQTHTTRLTFDLPGGKPRTDSAIRVGRAHAQFTVWAWGDEKLADVRVILPARFDADVHGWPDDVANQPHSTVHGTLRTYAVDDIADPNDWYATVDASDTHALTDVNVPIGGGAVTVRAWPEDKEWLDRVTTVLRTGYPQLETAVGLPWPVSGELDVSEVSSDEIEGYAGLYDSATDQIQISEDLDRHLILHEAAHAWFDGSLFTQRWITEGLADEYAARLVGTNEDGSPDVPPVVTPRSAGNFMLDAWPPPSRIDTTTQTSERYGYDASWTVVHQLVDEVGEARMRAIFAAASAHELAYPGAGPAETAVLTTDWRRFLDLLENVGGSTKATDLFATWVVTGSERSELTARTTARARYDALLARGGEWLPGILVRKPMSSWDFEVATAAIDEAERVLDARDRLAAATTELGLDFPGTLEPAYESAAKAEDLDALGARLTRWLDAAAAVRSARDTLAATRQPLTAIGLIGSEPERAYQAALAAWNNGDDAGAQNGSASALAVLSAAGGIGRDRALVAAGVAASALLLLLIAIWLIVRRRRAVRRGPALAAASGVTVGPFDAPAEPPFAAPGLVNEAIEPGAVPPEPYATLAATPGPVDETGSERGVVGGTEAD